MSMRQFWNMTAHRGRDSITPPRHQRPMRGASPRAHRRASVGASPLRRPARTKQRTRRRLSFTQKCAAIGAAVGICARQPLDDATEEALTPCEPPKPAARPFVPVCTTEEPVQGNELVRFRRLPRFEYDEGNATPNPYAVLNVPRDATLKQIKAAYKELAFMYHPDRITTAARLSLGGLDPAVAFSRINNAYSVLVDDYERTRFHAMETMLEEDISRLGEIKRRNAMLDVELMQEALKANIAYEFHRNGVVVVRALYGEMPERVDVYRTMREQAFGEVIDVTKPVQYLVRDSKILVPGGASKVVLKGFYDPVNGYPKVLAIRYMFKGRLHQVVLNDFDRIRVPCQAHLMPNECQDLVMLEMDDDINDIVDAAPTTPRRAPPRTPRSAARSARSARSSGFAHQGHPHPRVAQTPRKRGGRRTKQPPIHEQAGAGVGSDCADDTGAAAEADVQPVVRTRHWLLGIAAVAVAVGIARPDLVRQVRDHVMHGTRMLENSAKDARAALMAAATSTDVPAYSGFSLGLAPRGARAYVPGPGR